MRVLRNAGIDVGCTCNLRNQYGLTARVEHLWDEWEIQILVLVSFALQVFLLLFSGVRKRSNPGVVSILLWLAYVSADSLAVFVLGHLTLHINGRRHGLALFWAPFMLLHLGGQETITAFSMEDNMLWKRHLLSLVTQVGLAAYVVGKQWQGDKLLLAPMVLMFISGTIKYAGRTSALMLASKPDPGLARINFDEGIRAIIDSGPENIMEGEQTYQDVVVSARYTLTFCLALLMDMKPTIPIRYVRSIRKIQSNQHRVHDCYKLVEVQLSLAYDYFYTKLGARFFQRDPLNGRFLWLVTIGSTITSLVLFAWTDLKGSHNYNRIDIVVSYILLIGAIILEMLSIFTVTSSYWEYVKKVEYEKDARHDAVGYCSLAVHYFSLPSAAIFSVVKLVHPEGRLQWSEKLAQYNLIGVCMNAKRAADRCGVLGWIMKWVKRDTKHIGLTVELKKFLLDKLLEVSIETNIPRGDDAWDASKFTGQWAKLELRRQGGHPNLQALLTECVEGVDFIFFVLTWHMATDIFFFYDDELAAGCSSSAPLKTTSRELSNYVMYLSAKHGVMSGNDGRNLIKYAQQWVSEYLLKDYQGAHHQQSAVVGHILKSIQGDYPSDMPNALIKVFYNAQRLTEELGKIKEASDQWGIIINVWMEMLCYMHGSSQWGWVQH